MPGIRKIKNFTEILLISSVEPSGQHLWMGAHVVVRKAEQGTRSFVEGRPEFLYIESEYAETISDVFWHVRNLAVKKQMYDHGNKFYFFELLAKSAVNSASSEVESSQLQEKAIRGFCEALINGGGY